MQTKMLVKKPESANNPVNNNHKNKPAENKKNVRTTDYKKLLQMMLNDPDAITREEFLFLQSIIGYRQAVAAREKAKLRKQQRKIEQTNAVKKPILLERKSSEIGKGSDREKGDTSSEDSSAKTPIQMKKDEGNTSASSSSMQHNLKAGLEKLSGVELSDVKVHQNSDKPQQVGALAYTQGNDIHVAPGQEKHIPHEGWHAVQQKQGRVTPTMQMKTGALVNDNAGLEKEADVMGAKAEKEGLQTKSLQPRKLSYMQQESKVIQRITQEEAMRLSKQNTHNANTGYSWNIKAGEYNRYVFEAQDMLRDIGYNLSKHGVDGKWSPGGETYNALLKFQKTCKNTYNGLKQNAPAQTLVQVNYMQGVEPTGKLDKATYDALKKEKGNKIIRIKQESERANKKKKELAIEAAKKAAETGKDGLIPQIDKSSEPLSGKIFAGTLALEGGLAADDLTGIGVVDDVAIPVIAVGGIAIVIGMKIYEMATDAGKNEQHGDAGRALEKANKQMEDLQKQLKNAKSNKEKNKIKQKIKNVRESAEKKKTGENHSQGKKR